jgi:4-hydroxybenzoate polyprenyltransferase
VSHLLRLIRLPNLFIIVLSQYLTACCLSLESWSSVLLSPKLFLLSLSTSLIAAAGYVINDYLDVKIDQINKPGKVVVGTYISRRQAIYMHIIMNVLALICAVFIGLKIFAIELATALLLIKYSSTYKRTFFTGNFMVALFCGTSIFMVYLIFPLLSFTHVMAYSIFAFITTINREIIKDIEDIKGDRLLNCKTVPIVLGLKKTKDLVFIISSALLTASIIYFYELFKSGRIHDHSKVFFAAYVLLLLVMPFFYMLFKLNDAARTEDFTRISTINKLIMLTGILTMLFFVI